MDMSGIDFAHDQPGWQISDVLSDQEFALQPGFSTNDQQFNIGPSPFFDANPFLGQELANTMSGNSPASRSEPAPMGSPTFDQPYDYAVADFGGPTTNEFISTCLPPPLEDPQSASQLATERALYMNAPVHAPSSLHDIFPQDSFMSGHPLNRSPSLDYCSSPETSDTYNESEDGSQEENLNSYGLPGIYSPQRASQVTTKKPSTTEDDDLTPLEMPDGSTRLTANWLPVDPEGGFTIAEPGMQTAGIQDDGNMFDMGIVHHAKDAFFSVEPTIPTFGV